MRCLLVAEDSVWARMTPEEACLIQVASVSGQKLPETMPKTALQALFPFSPPNEPRPFPQADLPCTTASNSSGSWIFAGDGNAATHLVRNCVARGDAELAQILLSARGGLVRQMRDDISAV